MHGGVFIMKNSQKNVANRKETLRITSHFKDELIEVYDLLIGAGMEPIEAIRKTRSTLKAIQLIPMPHPML